MHAALLAWWASLPAPPPRVAAAPPDPRVIEWIEIPAPIVVEAQPSPPPTPAAEAPPAEPRLPDEASTTPSPSPRPSPRPKGPAGSPSPAPSPEPEASERTAAPVAPGGVALLGLRSDSRAAGASGSLRPELAPPAMGHGRVVRSVGSQRPPPSAFDDGEPRSLEEAGFRTRRNGTQVFRDPTGRFTATLQADGRLKFRDMPVAISRDPITGAPKGVGMAGLAEGLRAASGQELYHEDKKRLLEQTFELRLQIAIAFARDGIERRLQSLYRELLADWGDTSTSEAERREALFRRWDECEEGLPVSLPGFGQAQGSEIDDLRRSAGTEARETIERFVRRQLPAGSPQAFTAEELRRLNASRRSRDRFAPYD